MPLHERRTVFVKINGGLGNGILRVCSIGKFTAVLKNLRTAVRLNHCLQQQIDNLRVKITADQNLGRGAEKRDVLGWDNSINVDYALWKHQLNEVGINSNEGIS